MNTKNNTINIIKKRMTQLFSLQYGSAIISFLGVIVITSVFHEYFSKVAKIWFLINVGIFLIRVTLIYVFQKKLNYKNLSFNAIVKIENIYALFLLCTGISWGVIFHIYAHSAPKDLLLFLPMAPLAALMGGTLNLLLSPKSALAIASGILIPLASYFFIDITFLSFGSLAGSFIIIAAIYITANKNCHNFTKTYSRKDKSLKYRRREFIIRR